MGSQFQVRVVRSGAASELPRFSAGISLLLRDVMRALTTAQFRAEFAIARQSFLAFPAEYFELPTAV